MSKRTIVTIAERAGVSPATVSRALNNQPGVGEAKRREIVALAQELDYQPNVIARSLQGQRTGTVAYVADISARPAADLLFKDFITIMADGCAADGLDLLIHPATDGAFEIERLGRLIRSGRADGLIIADTRTDDPRVRFLTERQLPFIAFGRSREVTAPYPYVDIDGTFGIQTVTEHLLARSHSRIAYLGMPRYYCYATYRYEGYQRALEAAGLPLDPDLVAFVGDEPSIYAAVQRLFELPNPPSAIVAASDMLAIHAIAAAGQRGLRAGADFAITGFDDLPLAAFTTPPLTTIRQPFAQACAELIALLGRVLNDRPGPQQVLLKPELVVRQSG